jgi:hypothetical protein
MRRFSDAASQAPLSANPREAGFLPAENAFEEKPKRQEQINSVLKDCGAQVTSIAGTGNCLWWALERALCSDPKLGVTADKEIKYGSYAEEEPPDSPVTKWKQLITTYYHYHQDNIPEGIKDSLRKNTEWMSNPLNIDNNNYCDKEWAWCAAKLVGRPIWVVVINESEQAYLQVFDPDLEPFFFDNDPIDSFLDEKREVAANKYAGIVSDENHGVPTFEPIVLTIANKHFDLITGYDNDPDFESVLKRLTPFEFDGIKMYTLPTL